MAGRSAKIKGRAKYWDQVVVKGRRKYTNTCKNCGMEFHPYSRRTKYCSRECAAKNNPQSQWRLIEKICPCCRKPYKPTRQTQVFCTKECFYVWEREVKGCAKKGELYKCKTCSVYKPLTDYYLNELNTTRRDCTCKDCKKKQRRKTHLMSSYGITEEDYDKMFQDQNGCCAMCGRHQSEFNKRLAVDHNHKTGHIRGLLCTFCNSRVLKHFGDRKHIAEGLVKYLMKSLKEDKNWKKENQREKNNESMGN